MKHLGLTLVGLVVGLVVTTTSPRQAAAYPQYQLSKGQTCTECHVSPSGGGLLGEYGRDVAEENSTWGGNPAFIHGKVPTPDWLQLGGDVRLAGGTIVAPTAAFYVFPMQYDLYGVATKGHLSLTVNAGFKPGDAAIDYLHVREHYLTYRTDPDDANSLSVRAGRFMPVYGLRLAEHPAYTRRYGGTPLFGETYGVAVEVVKPAWEAHLTGFMHDPLQYSSEQGDGAALYLENRFGENTSLGVEARYAHTDAEYRVQGGVTAKHWCACRDILLSAEVQGVHQHLDGSGGRRTQLVAYGMASWFPKSGWMVDLGLGHYDEDLSIKDLDRDAADLNVHWFPTSHFELALTSRLEMLAFGNGGRSGGYSLLQVHYRL